MMLSCFAVLMNGTQQEDQKKQINDWFSHANVNRACRGPVDVFLTERFKHALPPDTMKASERLTMERMRNAE